MTPRRLLFVIDSLGAGGAERSLTEMLPLLRRAGVDTHVACLVARREGFHDEVVAGGTPVTLVTGRTFVGRAARLARLIRRLAPDLVHSTLFWSDVTSRVARLAAPTPHVTSLVNTSYEPVRLQDRNVRRWRLGGVQAIDASTALLTTHFHAISAAVRDSAVRRLGLSPARITVVERGRDPIRLGAPGSERRARVRRTLGVSDETELLLAVGRQEFQKGHVHLLEALRSLAARRPRALLLLAGRAGTASVEVAERVRTLGLEDRVRVLGHREDVGDLLAAADLFVFPSLFEGLGGSVLEAMALALPIVASRLPALEEVLVDGETGVLVPPADPRGLARAIEGLLDDPARRAAMGEAARRAFDERFDLARVVERMLGMYSRVLAGCRR